MKKLLSTVSLMAILNVPSFGSTPSDEMTAASQIKSLNTATEIESFLLKCQEKVSSNDFINKIQKAQTHPAFEQIARNAIIKAQPINTKKLNDLLENKTVNSALQLYGTNSKDAFNLIKKEIIEKAGGYNPTLSNSDRDNLINGYGSGTTCLTAPLDIMLKTLKLTESKVSELTKLRESKEIEGIVTRNFEWQICEKEEIIDIPQGFVTKLVYGENEQQKKHFVKKHNEVLISKWKAINKLDNLQIQNGKGITTNITGHFFIFDSLELLNAYKTGEENIIVELNLDELCPCTLKDRELSLNAQTECTKKELGNNK